MRELTRFVKKILYNSIDLKINSNAVYTKDYILDFLIYVTTLSNSTITNGYRHYDETGKNGKVIHPNTVFYHLYKLRYEDVEKMLKVTTRKFLKLVRMLLGGRVRVDVAIDTTNWLYYGKDVPGVVRVKPREGTSKGFKFMTVNVVVAGLRFTVAVKPILEFTDEVKALEWLINEVKKHFEIRCVYLDRHFFTVDFIAKLQELGVKFVMPAVKNKKIRKLVELSDTKIREYEMTKSSDRRKSVRFNLFVVEDDGEKLVFASNLSPHYHSVIADMYRKRWGIETSYMVKSELRLKTCSRKYVVRFFFFALSVILYNAWILLNLLYELLNFSRILPNPIIKVQTFLSLILRFKINYYYN
jgi:hypothetical protein